MVGSLFDTRRDGGLWGFLCSKYDLPIVLDSGAPDGEPAAAATRLDVDEHYPCSTADRSLIDRVRTHLPAEDPTVARDGRERFVHTR